MRLTGALWTFSVDRDMNTSAYSSMVMAVESARRKAMSGDIGCVRRLLRGQKHGHPCRIIHPHEVTVEIEWSHLTKDMGWSELWDYMRSNGADLRHDKTYKHGPLYTLRVPGGPYEDREWLEAIPIVDKSPPKHWNPKRYIELMLMTIETHYMWTRRLIRC